VQRRGNGMTSPWDILAWAVTLVAMAAIGVMLAWRV
jgi:hypothetical protein